VGLEELRRLAEAEPTLENLRALRTGIEAQLRSINDTAGEGDLTPEQSEQWRALDEEHAATVARIETEERAERVRASRERWRSTQFGQRVDPFDGRDVRRMTRGEVRSRALAVLDQRESVEHIPSGIRAGVQEHVARMLRTQSKNFDGEAFARLLLVTESEAYRSAFMKLVARGSRAVLTPEEGRAVEAMQEIRGMSLSDAEGGYAVPVLIDPTIILTGQGHPNDFFDIARVEMITTDTWKGVSSAGATSYWTTEGGVATDGSPTLAQPSVPTERLTTYVPYSFEVGGDYPSFAEEMGRVMGESHNEKLVEGFTTGLGTTAQPTGIVTALEAAAGSQVGVSTDGELNPEDIDAMWDALPIRFRNNARWMSSTSVENAIRGFAAGSAGGDSNYSINITQERVPALRGKPYHLNDYMDDAFGTGNVTSASDVSLLIVGDWRHFLIARRVGATVEQVQHVIDTTTGTPTGQRALLMWARVGSDSIVDGAFRILTND
jgi:HK97 family phage major capsid protein